MKVKTKKAKKYNKIPVIPRIGGAASCVSIEALFSDFRCMTKFLGQVIELIAQTPPVWKDTARSYTTVGFHHSYLNSGNNLSTCFSGGHIYLFSLLWWLYEEV